MLMATELRRTDSMVRPQMFQYDQHFDFEEVIGRSTMSEVGRPHHPHPPPPAHMLPCSEAAGRSRGLPVRIHLSSFSATLAASYAGFWAVACRCGGCATRCPASCTR